MARRPKKWQPSGRSAEFGMQHDSATDVSREAQQFEDSEVMDLVESFMKVHSVMEAFDRDMSETGNVSLALLDELERQAHGFYDRVEMLRGVVRFREVVGV